MTLELKRTRLTSLSPSLALPPSLSLRTLICTLVLKFPRAHLFGSPSTHLLHFHHHYSIQALTTLDLGRNRIGKDGAECLVIVLKNNTVSRFFHVFITRAPSLSNIDTHNSGSSHKYNQLWRGRQSEEDSARFLKKNPVIRTCLKCFLNRQPKNTKSHVHISDQSNMK